MPTFDLRQGESLEHLQTFPDNFFDSVVTDAPYGLGKQPDMVEVLTHWLAGDDFEHQGGGFMGMSWDSFVPGPVLWREVLRVLKPGGHVVCFFGSRTYDLGVVAMRLAGFEIRDCLMWIYACLSDDTELLIDGVWVPHHKAKKGQLTLCYNKDHDSFEWLPIEEMHVYPYADTAYRLHSADTDQIVSRNHRVIVERGNRREFVFAEEAAREQAVHVPFLESLQGLLPSFSVHDERAGASQPDVLPPVRRDGDPRTPPPGHQVSRGEEDGSGVLRGLWTGGVEAGSLDAPGCHTDVFLRVQRGVAGERAEETCSQGAGSLDAGRGSPMARKNDWGTESRLEGRRNDSPYQGELRGSVVCTLSTGVQGNGAGGWLCDAAPPSGGSAPQSVLTQDGGSPSRQSQSPRQSPGEPDAVCFQLGSQEIRGERRTRTTLATITPEWYEGTVWCATVPTGAFVARRNGKIFVTGNSGYPKNHDISKALDKEAGAEREVIGHSLSGRRKQSSWNPDGTSTGVFRANDDGYAVTAPATEQAKEWAGWGTAIKPAYEPVVVARKPDHAEPSIIDVNLLRVEARLWSLLLVKPVEKVLKLNPPELGEALAFAQWTAEEALSTREDLSAQMGMWPLESVIHTTLSTVSSWRSTLADHWNALSKSTTKTSEKTTTDWKTLKSCSLAITPENIIWENTPQLGLSQNVPSAVRYFSAELRRLRDTQTLSALAPAISKEAQTSLGVVEGPSYEPVVLARKPLVGTVVRNVSAYGVGGINIGGCRIGEDGGCRSNQTYTGKPGKHTFGDGLNDQRSEPVSGLGRWPANVLLDGSSEVLAAFPADSSGLSASRFFYGGKATPRDRHEGLPDPGVQLGSGAMLSKVEKNRSELKGNTHATVKPTALMRWLCRLVTPPGGVMLDLFMGSGSTGKAAMLEGFNFVGIERDAHFVEVSRARCAYALEKFQAGQGEVVMNG